MVYVLIMEAASARVYWQRRVAAWFAVRRVAIYTLDGRRVYDKPARKGIYISDGKKEVSGK